MKTKNYKYGDWKCKAYFKTVGHGYEVGFFFNQQQIFVGNFIHSKEANYWWNFMNKEFKSFTKKYWVGSNASVSWYRKFFSNHIYHCYYKHLDKLFAKYQKDYTRGFNKEFKKYRQYKKNWHTSERVHIKRAS